MTNSLVTQKYELSNLKFRAGGFALLYGVALLVVLITQDITFFLLVTLFLVLVGYFVFQRDINLFEPFTLFTLYYFSILLAGFHLYASNFKNTIFIQATSFSNDLEFLLNLALVYFISGYIFAFIGYKFFVKSGKPNIILDDGVSRKVVWLIIVVFSGLAFANFFFNIYLYAGGNIFVYLANVSVRHLEFEYSGTDLGYLFGYMAAYLWFYILLKDRKFSVLFTSFLFLTILMKASTGRIFQTLLYITSFMAIYYIVNLHAKKHSNLKYLLIGGLIGVMSVYFYFFRITSSLMYNKMVSTGWLETILSYMDWEKILYYAVDEGNIPNIAVFMKIIDSWANDIGFLYGESLFTWVFSILPSSIRPVGYQPSVMIKHIWYLHIHGGALPPTGIGEMYANFGVLGPFLGMFIFGAFAAFLYNMLFKFNNYWYLVIYVQISIGFIMLYPKGEFDNLSLWQVLPILMTIALIKFIQISLRKVHA